MDERYEIRLAGRGGQGLLLAGIMLSEAAILYDGKHAVQTESYSAAVRGGSSRSDIIISSAPIDYPFLLRADLLLALSQEACDEYYASLKVDGLLVVDSDLVSRVPSPRALQLPLTAIAQAETGRAITANVVSLGVIVGLTDVVSREALIQAVTARAPRGTAESNLRALEAGFQRASKFKERSFLETLAQIAERGSIAAVARLRGAKEETIRNLVRAAAKRRKTLERILAAEYKLSRAQLDALWALAFPKGRKGSVIL